jgi:hypothetical protein
MKFYSDQSRTKLCGGRYAREPPARPQTQRPVQCPEQYPNRREKTAEMARHEGRREVGPPPIFRHEQGRCQCRMRSSPGSGQRRGRPGDDGTSSEGSDRSGVDHGSERRPLCLIRERRVKPCPLITLDLGHRVHVLAERGRKRRRQAGTRRDAPKRRHGALYVGAQAAVSIRRVRASRKHGYIERCGHGGSPSALRGLSLLLRVNARTLPRKSASRPKSVQGQSVG